MTTNLNNQVSSVGNSNKSSQRKSKKISAQSKQNSMQSKGISSKLKIGDILDVNINAVGFKKIGIAELPNGYGILVPNTNVGDYVKVEIVKINSSKTKYAIAKLLQIIKSKENKLPMQVGEILDLTVQTSGQRNVGIIELPNKYKIIVPHTKAGDQVKLKISRIKNNYAIAKVLNFLNSASQTNQVISTSTLNTSLVQGSQLTVIIPNSVKSYANHLILKLNDKPLVVKLALGVKKGDKVRVKITKVTSKFFIGKILNVNPVSKTIKQLKIKSNLKTMLKHGMQYGGKVLKCHARMRRFIWIRRKGTNINRPLIKKGRSRLNLLQTRNCLLRALKQLSKYAIKGRTFLFVGSKQSAATLVARAALLTKTSFFVNTRWLGGMLTNWKTILKSISKIKPILKEKQQIIKNISQKRRRIKLRLFKKVNFLRIKSKDVIQKGTTLILKVKTNKQQFLDKSEKLLKQRTLLIKKGQLLIDTYKNLILKNKSISAKNIDLTERANQLIKRKTHLVKQLISNKKQLKELQMLLSVSEQLTKLKQIKNQQGNTLWTIAYRKLVKINTENNFNKNIVPLPPKELLNKIITTLRKTSEMLANNSTELLTNRSKNESSNIIVVSKILNQFTELMPYIQKYSEMIQIRLFNIQQILVNLTENIKAIKNQIQQCLTIQNKLSINIQFIKTKILAEQKTMHTLKSKLKKLASQQRFLRFLPKLKSLSKSTNKIVQTIQIIMKKFVDPKMIYPMDGIYDDKLKSKSNKLAAARKKKWQRLEKYFGGIRKMVTMKNTNIQKNVAIIIGQKEELNAVRECKKLGIKMFHIVDTNCNPLLADHVIPANDDSRNSIKFILSKMLKNIRLAQKIRNEVILKRVKKGKKLILNDIMLKKTKKEKN